MPITFPSVPYTTLQAIQNRLSINGVVLRMDDVPPSTLGEVIEEASSIIDEHAAHRYTQANLATSNWIYFRATDIACYLLCERRGNPVPIGIAQRYERAIAKLEQVYNGRFNIWDIPERKSAIPTMSNMRIVLRPFPRAVVETGNLRSTGTVTQYQRNRDPAEFYFGSNSGLDLAQWFL